MKLLATAVLSTVLLGGCASWFGGEQANQPTPLHAIKAEQKLAIKWSEDIGDTSRGGFTPLYRNGNVIVANSEGSIRVLDATSGRTFSRWDLRKTELTGGVAADDSSIYVGTGDGSLLAIDRSNGKARWRQSLTSIALEAPVLVGQVLVVHTNDGRLTGFDVQDGKQLWSVSRSLPQLIVRNTASLSAVGNEALLSGQAGGRLQALRPNNGDVLWDVAVANPRGASELERVTDVVSRPVFDHGQICAAAYQGRVACFDARSGNLMWARELSSSQGLAVDDQRLYATADDGSVWAFDRGTGRNLWKLDDLKYRNVSGPALIGGNVLVVDGEGYAHLINAGDGRLVGRHKVGTDALTAQPVSLGDTVLLQGSSGRLALVSLG
ncbi:outer membrane protein assembly factor BamB [Crenobacter sp. SG2305]|uniref:outer membrane protein assembly factor BamB n=1 Tax=Crenobacter oryzisoli TaxID=3056844 RepID=UPI0025AA78A9|nr:outer membrane protein assembly factor BamB [Crenobacter sp. SG2305]MDN0081376.1 outer membrane protein assembly factor BamB [Crenobacter sp. SG2305]